MWISISGLVFVLLIVLINLSIGFLVISRNSKSMLNRWFLIMALGVTLWAASSSISDNTTSYLISRYSSFLAYGGSCFGVCAAAIFARVFYKKNISKGYYWFFIICSLLSLLYSTPLVYNLTTFTDYELGPLYWAYVATMLLMLGVVVANFVGALRHGDASQRTQGKYILSGFFLMVALGLITNALIPAFVDTTVTTKIGPTFTVIFVGAVAYAIVKHRLFDIRLVVARSLAYLLSLGVLFMGYAFVSSLFLRVILGDNSDNTNLILVNSASLTAAVLAYQPIKRFFDRITNKLFYRDAYDGQMFIEEFNNHLVSTYELKPLLQNSATIIGNNLKPDYTAFVIKDGQGGLSRIVGVGRHNLDHNFVHELSQHMPKVGKKMIITDELEGKHTDLQRFLSRNNVALVSPLVSSASKEGAGYLVLGAKKTGNLYNTQDLRILEIIGNELVIAIQNALRFEEIKNFNLTLQQKVNEATYRLRRVNDKLKALDETKDDFISMASHQLRTPLTSIKGYISMVLEGDAGSLNKTQKEMLNQSFISSQRMVYLIADLLNVSRLKTGKFVIEKSLINLADVIDQELSQVKQVAEAKSVKLIYDKPKDFPELMIDDTKTRQVIMNLVDNAIYYTPSGGEVRVELADKPTAIELRVKDNGIGVPKSEQHHLFTKFYRAGNARKARPDGTGLGLFMAKKVVVSQGGVIIFESKEGKGSTFGFVFNKRKLEEPVNQPSVKPVPAAEKT